METSNSFDKSFNVSVLDTVSPFSQRDTAYLVTMIFSANSSCDSPFCMRSFKMIFFVSIAATSLTHIIQINSVCGKQLAVAIVL